MSRFSPNNMTEKIPSFGNKTRFEALDQCRFFLLINGMISDGDSDKIRLKIKKSCIKQGLNVTTVPGFPTP